MSVINQMLVDLERRRASGEERNRIPDHVRVLPGDAQAARLSTLRVAAPAVLVLIAAMYVFTALAFNLMRALPAAALGGGGH